MRAVDARSIITGIVRLLGLGDAKGETSKKEQGEITPDDKSSIVQHGYVAPILACGVSIGAGSIPPPIGGQ
jgi:hypothetical protein